MFTLKMSIGKAKQSIGKTPITTPLQVYELCKDFSELSQEVFCILCLNGKGKLISKNIITIGLVNQTLAHPREIFKVAIQDSATSIVLVHNHPTGDPYPSQADIKLTNQVIEGSKFLLIPVIDHVIIGKEQDDAGLSSPFYSLRDKGLCNFSSGEDVLKAAE